jgi:hypothetical protein
MLCAVEQGGFEETGFWTHRDTLLSKGLTGYAEHKSI